MFHSTSIPYAYRLQYRVRSGSVLRNDVALLSLSHFEVKDDIFKFTLTWLTPQWYTASNNSNNRLMDSVFIFVSICVVSMSAVCNITYLGIVAVSFQSNVNVYGPYWIYSTVRMSASTIVYSNKFSNRMKPSKFFFNETTNGMFVANVLYICCFFFKLLSLRCHFHKYKYRPCIKTSFVLLAELVSFSLVFRSIFSFFSIVPFSIYS